MRRLLACIVFWTLATAALAQGLPEKFDPARDAARDVATAAEQAKAQGKRVLVDVGGEWCAWCHILDRFVEADTEARALRDANFVVVKVNWSPENKNEALLSRWPAIPGYPHLFVLDADGKLVHSQETDVLEPGKGYDRREGRNLSQALRAAALPCERPRHVLAHEGRRIVRARLQRCDDRRVARRVAEADREIAQPALVADAANRAAFHPRVEFGFGPREQFDQRAASRPWRTR